MYMETYSRRENLKFFGLPENSDALDSSNYMEEESSRQSGTSENMREVLYKFLEEQLKIDRPHDKIKFQRVHRLGKPNPLKAHPIIARFLRYSDRELVVEQARKHLRKNQNLHVFDNIPKELYDLQKEQIVKLKEAQQKGHTASAKRILTNYLSMANISPQNSHWNDLRSWIQLCTLSYPFATSKFYILNLYIFCYHR